MALFENYRKGAARRARSFAAIGLIIVVAWASYALLNYGNERLDRLFGLEQPFFGKTLVAGGGELTEWVTVSMFIALGFFVVGLWTIRWWLNRPKFADLVIETEAELRRVTWAPIKEVNRATVVVLYFVFWLSVILFMMDLTFSMGTGMLQGQSAKNVGWGRIYSLIFDRFGEEQPDEEVQQ
jgi:preprotein translocase SecE subunit